MTFVRSGRPARDRDELLGGRHTLALTHGNTPLLFSTLRGVAAKSVVLASVAAAISVCAKVDNWPEPKTCACPCSHVLLNTEPGDAALAGTLRWWLRSLSG